MSSLFLPAGRMSPWNMGMCLFVCLFVKLPAVERDIPVLVDSEEHGGGGEGGQAGELTLAHLRFSLRLSLRLVKLLL